jgi:hypothetical protein
MKIKGYHPISWSLNSDLSASGCRKMIWLLSPWESIVFPPLLRTQMHLSSGSLSCTVHWNELVSPVILNYINNKKIIIQAIFDLKSAFSSLKSKNNNLIKILLLTFVLFWQLKLGNFWCKLVLNMFFGLYPDALRYN